MEIKEKQRLRSEKEFIWFVLTEETHRDNIDFRLKIQGNFVCFLLFALWFENRWKFSMQFSSFSLKK